MIIGTDPEGNTHRGLPFMTVHPFGHSGFKDMRDYKRLKFQAWNGKVMDWSFFMTREQSLQRLSGYTTQTDAEAGSSATKDLDSSANNTQKSL